MEIISRADAKALGLGRFYTGSPCKHGHQVERYVSDGSCVKCSSLKYHKQGRKDYHKQWRTANPNKCKSYYTTYETKIGRSELNKRKRVGYYERKYGLTYNEALDLKRAIGQCQCCGEAPDAPESLVIDHCHKTGEVRGVLCSSCNLGIGHLKDSPDILTRAITYLKKEYS